ncbi:dolichyl-P-Glc:Glc1Man9GlcNAc2-PP-dolichol alpha-1,3-glucosyltransferase [Malassezia sp. CBS 17886]|nr:dolichyl-P-Glc:Glc1Man9GlcNAc2-PP-dolichol alpha-1,3-glucosyltransferase [Malassezia sp. CBS 17886]
MPVVKRKPVQPVPLPASLAAAAPQENPSVFYLAGTGEIFSDYDQYAARLSFYHQRVFQCELSGKSNLTYFQAAESEAQHALATQKRFPDALKAPILRAVQFQITGRLDSLVDMVAERLRDRFFAGESVLVEVGEELERGDREEGGAKEGRPAGAGETPASAVEGPRGSRAHEDAGDTGSATAGAAAANGSEADGHGAAVDACHAPSPCERAHPPHERGMQLFVPGDEARRTDDPSTYVYTVQLVDQDGRFTGDRMDVHCDALSRDRLLFSKSILRKFLRDSVCRDAPIGSAWIVREALARRYHVASVPSDEMARKNEDIKEGKLSKRRKLLETDASAAKRKAREERKARKAAEEKLREAERLSAEAARKRKYPAEDLLLEAVTEKELRTETPGELPKRAACPAVSRDEFLGVSQALFEPFFQVYYFFLALGRPLGIAPVAYDDFEAALRHSTHDPACVLLAELHAVLLNAIVRDGTGSRDLAPALVARRRLAAAVAADAAAAAAASAAPSREGSAQPEPAAVPSDGESVLSDLDDEDAPEKHVMDAAHALGCGWERRTLAADVHRAGWEQSVVGCLADRATEEALPRLVGILAQLTGVEPAGGVVDGAPRSAPCRTVAERYPHLPLDDKVHILLFLCELAVVTRPVKAYYEECESHLTELRKERVEITRARKRILEQRQELEGGGGAQGPGDGAKEGADAVEHHPDDGEHPADDTPPPLDAASLPVDASESDSDSERDELASESDTNSDASDSDSSDADSDRYKRVLGARQESLREKALQRDAEQARHAVEAARTREQQRETKQLNAERRRIDDEAARLARRDDAIEREFRQYVLIPRLRPLGRDRFLVRYYWLDGIGAVPLSHSAAYQTGRLFVQAPAQREWDALCADYVGGADALRQRERGERQGDALAPGRWAVYTEPEQVEELIAWLRTKGTRENALKAQLLKYREYIEGGMRKRKDDIALGWREHVVETRRSSRVRTEQSSQTRLPYMTWRNGRAGGG